jgi:hypothetical protein
MKAILAAFFLLFAVTTLSAQNQPQTPQQPQQPTNPNETDSNPRFWQAAFANGGHYLVKLDRISFASKHEYVGNGAARVVEVTIGSDTSAVARFYWLEPLGKDTPIAAGNIIISRAEQVQKDVAGRVSPSLGKIQVIKDYPTTTHTHTVEYALQTPDALNSLYSSLMAAINTGRGRTWKEPSN